MEELAMLLLSLKMVKYAVATVVDVYKRQASAKAGMTIIS